MSQEWRRPWVLLLVIFLLTGMLYANSFYNPFFMDDLHTIVANPYIRTLTNIPAFFTNPDYFSVFGQRHMHYRPALLTTFALNYHWGEVSPGGYRLINLIFHFLSILMVYIMVQKLFANTPLALLSAVIFALHPFQAEAVNYISARSSSMTTVFYILTIYLFIVFRENQESKKSVYRITGFYILFLLSFSLALLSKEISLTLLAVLVLVDLLIVRVKGIRDALIKSVAYLPFILVAVVFSLRIHLYKFLSTVHYAHPFVQLQVLFMTPKFLLFPVGLSADHPVSQVNLFIQPVVIIPFLLLAILLAAGIRLAVSPGQTQKKVSFLILWFFVTSLPTTLFPLNQAFVEHRGYLPSVGLIPLLAMGINRAWSFIQGYSRYRLKEAFYVLGLMVLILYGNEVIKRNQVWHDPIKLWSDTLTKYPESKLGQLFLAQAYQDKGEQERAIELFQKIVSSDPECRHNFSCSKALLSLGTHFEQTGKLDQAIQMYQKTLQLVPDSYWVRYRLGAVYQKQDDLASAIKFYQEALEHNQTAYEVHYALGTLYESQKQYDLAKMEYEKALDRLPTFYQARLRLATVLVQNGLLNDGAQQFEEVLRTEPQNGSAHKGLAYVHETQGHLDLAIQHYQSAIAAGSDDPGFRFHLGSLYLKVGNKELAKQQWENAVTKAPDFFEARLSLAKLLQQEGHRDEAISQYRQLKAMLPVGERYQLLRGQVDAELYALENRH